MPDLLANSVHPLTRATWCDWLFEHHRRGEGIWLVSFKKATGEPRLTYDEAVEEALCFGWVDSKPAKLDEKRTMLYFAPRRPRTGWSKPNKERVERLNAIGLMTPAGLEKVEAAKRHGSWSKLNAVEALEVPDDLARPERRATLRDLPALGETRHPQVDRQRQEA